ncbi:TetR/AcrR family transcriptional regulator [Dactylosporangium matsuzakiense]|uniref:HTH tetR-type domain-containing protein n=1 Tax=Dactylosporangium matsuzakiense TaxID=53360 RepID=A0A9W6KSR1_9ACTN|nr:TetR/AcrR family transcriptional regulator [Dactylosporangium matsuzakiense]UWZ41367.1 TetR/AcrR family transcriptional regulator C-terminal domain-containing protein [Dactylosporangium matsuzakiense]GLL06465.1 hypothetical protein GCM10017581_082150 [Dactylosporangium matsuzakiense]
MADRDGLDAVSMKAMATHLGLSTMSLYRYLESKEELLSLMLHIAYGRPDLPPAADWRTGAEQWASALAARLHEHPWIVHVPMAEPPLEPNPLAWTEAGLAALGDTGLPVADQLSALLVIDGFVRSHTALSLQIGAVGAAREPRVRPAPTGSAWPPSSTRRPSRTSPEPARPRPSRTSTPGSTPSAWRSSWTAWPHTSRCTAQPDDRIGLDAPRTAALWPAPDRRASRRAVSARPSGIFADSIG